MTGMFYCARHCARNGSSCARRHPMLSKLLTRICSGNLHIRVESEDSRGTQNPVGFTPRVGSIPTSGTTTALESASHAVWQPDLGRVAEIAAVLHHGSTQFITVSPRYNTGQHRSPRFNTDQATVQHGSTRIRPRFNTDQHGSGHGSTRINTDQATVQHGSGHGSLRFNTVQHGLREERAVNAPRHLTARIRRSLFTSEQLTGSYRMFCTVPAARSVA